MLDNETKRRIDTARDILVGKVPDPKSQVEQITIALVYKFMDDIDKESVEMGGKASFFTGEYKKYGWSKIFAPQMGGFEMLALYADAITTMALNPNLPQLFRDIFKNAYLPYRDPETLKLFLKTINEFNYDHSERLGDAFEYLLSVLGSQGDAGQFRTPRHIIDFMVEVVKPQKHETILDPACGTAGFLVSSYKHIMRGNTKKTPGDLLTAVERKKLLANFKGYDISPDMVRLSLVNLYLHGFVQPKVFEYDTLTSEDRWNDYADVVLANPPFMSPKGGIIPHKRFTVQCNRSEVLFVDYIAEHITSTGRAAVIVPEGIIFQSAGAYKQLRKMLVETHLYAVVSLPAGVFNPYSGVKTSILFMDRAIAKKTDSILFMKIENDGFGLGAQRKEQTGSDLPGGVKVIEEWMKAVRAGKAEDFKKDEKAGGALVIEKKRIAEIGEYNLTGERYREVTRHKHTKWPIVKLGEICEINPKKAEVSNIEKSTFVSFVPMEDLNTHQYFTPKKQKTISEVYKGYTYFKDNDILVAKVTPCFENGKCGIAKNLENRIGFGSSEYHIIRTSEKTLPEFIYHFVASEKFRQNGKLQMTGTGGLQRVPSSYISSTQIPLPPLEIQREIVAEIEGYQKVIDGARQVVENWKPKIEIDPAWPVKPLGEIITLQRGYDLPKTQFIEGNIPVVGSNGIIGYHNVQKEIGPGVVTGRSGTIGKVHYIDSKHYWPHNTALFVKEFNGNDRKFIKYLLESLDLKSLGDNVSAVPSLDRKNAHRIIVSIPSHAVQREIVSRIESERAAVDGCKSLIAAYEEKIKKVIDKVWEG